MSQAVQRRGSEVSEEMTGFLEQDVRQVTVESPEDVRQVQAYALENPGYTFVVDYQFGPAVSVDALGETDPEHEEVYNRLFGGAKEPIDSGSMGIITSGDVCYQEFKQDLHEMLEKSWPHERNSLATLEREVDGMSPKDIYLEEGQNPQQYPKVVRTAARMTPVRAYGAIWRESPPSRELYDLMADLDGVTPEQWDRYARPVPENTGENFWNELTENAEEFDIDSEALVPEQFHYSEEPKAESPWCAIHIGPETTNKRTPDWNIGGIEPRN